ncbi:unnamed protein product [Brachionus calyciflorus]|uniref:MULE transposase domain-containing protein n=1 Tax=Brachionus calyciflorus TaxID=104777 RepID=A0A813YWX7_9BILA|nr:unnamed protein product [Brachionus calyciflorus]
MVKERVENHRRDSNEWHASRQNTSFSEIKSENNTPNEPDPTIRVRRNEMLRENLELNDETPLRLRTCNTKKVTEDDKIKKIKLMILEPDFFEKIKTISDLTILPTQRKRPKLLHELEFYTIDRITNTKIEWKCERTGSQSVPKCYGRVHTAHFNSPVEIITEHNHKPNDTKEEKIRTIEKIKTEAKNSISVNPRLLISKCLSGVNKEVAAQMPKNTSLTQIINRIRRELFSFETTYKRPDSVAQVIIPEFVGKTLTSNENFYFDDSGTDYNSRIVEIRYFDGTFDITPDHFKQLYTILVNFNRKILPLPNKQTETYVKFFEMIKNSFDEDFEPKKISIDFEKACINTFHKIFPNTSISGCFFHFSQNLWKHFQESALIIDFKQNNDVRDAFGFVEALPFVPESDVPISLTRISPLKTEQKSDITNTTLYTYARITVSTSPNDSWVYKDACFKPGRYSSNMEVDTWWKRFELYVKSANFTIGNLRYVLLSCIDDECMVIFENCTPDHYLSLDELKEQMKKLFGNLEVVNVDSKANFYNRRQSAGEDTKTYFSDLWKLLKMASQNESTSFDVDKCILDRFINGLNDPYLMMHLSAELPHNSFETLTQTVKL